MSSFDEAISAFEDLSDALRTDPDAKESKIFGLSVSMYQDPRVHSEIVQACCCRLHTALLQVRLTHGWSKLDDAPWRELFSTISARCESQQDKPDSVPLSADPAFEALLETCKNELEAMSNDKA